MKKALILHGEAMIFQSEIPANAVPIKSSHPNFHIIADSETTGNHHVVDCNAIDFQFFRTPDGTVYMKNAKETNVRCVVADRHDAIKISPGSYEFGIQKEYDHFEKHLKNVRD